MLTAALCSWPPRLFIYRIFSLFCFKSSTVCCAVMLATLFAVFAFLCGLGAEECNINILVMEMAESCKPICKATFVVTGFCPRPAVGTSSYSLYMPDLNWLFTQWRDCCHAKPIFRSFAMEKRGVHPLLCSACSCMQSFHIIAFFLTFSRRISAHAGASCLSVSRHLSVRSRHRSRGGRSSFVLPGRPSESGTVSKPPAVTCTTRAKLSWSSLGSQTLAVVSGISAPKLCGIDDLSWNHRLSFSWSISQNHCWEAHTSCQCGISNNSDHFLWGVG